MDVESYHTLSLVFTLWGLFTEAEGRTRKRPAPKWLLGGDTANPQTHSSAAPRLSWHAELRKHSAGPWTMVRGTYESVLLPREWRHTKGNRKTLQASSAGRHPSPAACKQWCTCVLGWFKGTVKWNHEINIKGNGIVHFEKCSGLFSGWSSETTVQRMWIKVSLSRMRGNGSRFHARLRKRRMYWKEE